MLLPDSYDGNPLALLQILGYINTSLAIVNLLPVLPLDGGRISVALVWMIKYRFFERGYYFAVMAASRFISPPLLGVALGAWMVFAGFSAYILLLGVLIGITLRSEYLAARSKTLFDSTSLHEVMVPIVETDLDYQEYGNKLPRPIETHYVGCTVKGERSLVLISVLDIDELDSDGNPQQQINCYWISFKEMPDSDMSVGAFLAHTRLDTPGTQYVMTRGDRWVGVVGLHVLREKADEYVNGSSDAESPQP
jgi:hypothetical protein